VRVVAGRWRGRRLEAPAGDAARPTTDRVKEALFSILGRRVEAAHVVDLCCGSGGLGIEALSRGAAYVDFVDAAPASLAAVEKNLQACRAEPSRYRVWRAEAAGWLDRQDADLPAQVLLIADPPYADALAGELWGRFLRRAASDRLVLAVLEHRPDRVLDPPPPGWIRRDKRYGATGLAILEREE
jgi:16S rRNA (guanine966-N2)-methyltransferase